MWFNLRWHYFCILDFFSAFSNLLVSPCGLFISFVVSLFAVKVSSLTLSFGPGVCSHTEVILLKLSLCLNVHDRICSSSLSSFLHFLFFGFKFSVPHQFLVFQSIFHKYYFHLSISLSSPLILSLCSSFLFSLCKLCFHCSFD